MDYIDQQRTTALKEWLLAAREIAMWGDQPSCSLMPFIEQTHKSIAKLALFTGHDANSTNFILAFWDARRKVPGYTDPSDPEADAMERALLIAKRSPPFADVLSQCAKSLLEKCATENLFEARGEPLKQYVDGFFSSINGTIKNRVLDLGGPGPS